MQSERTFHKIIVGCDGRDPGRDALALAGLLGGLTDADVIAIGVYPDPMLPFPSHVSLRDGYERQLSADRDAYAPMARIRAVAALSPAAALRHALEREHGDLLVLGSAAGTRAGQVHPGRHARQLLHGSPCAVLLAPAAYASTPTALRRILVGFDGSPESAAVLAQARALAAATGARVRAATAVDTMPPLSGFEAMVMLPDDWERMGEAQRREARETLDDALAGATDVETAVIDGAPGVALGEASRDADLLMLGSRHWGPLARLVLGSSADYIVHNAHCPVLVVPRSATATASQAAPEAAAAAS